jgi:NADH-quinone oxidoreductase subunit N
MYAEFQPLPVEYLRALPEIVLVVFGALLMILEALAGDGHRRSLGGVAMVGVAAALSATVVAHANAGPAFRDLLIVDGFATFFRAVTLTAGFLTVLCSIPYLRRENADSGEFYALVLFSLAGQSLMVSSNELIMIFIGLEISSIASYILAGYLRDDRRNNESAIKYFLLGSFATAFLLYGVAWVYGLTGSTSLAAIRASIGGRVGSPAALAAIPMPSEALLGAAAALMFVGLAFKVSAAPFQIWAPDVYQGAPAPVSAFLSAAPKAAAFAVLLRVFLTAFEPISSRWEPVVWTSAILTMIVGNFAALRQSNIKRMLAYSSIAHAGYVLVAVRAHSETGTAAAMFYLAAYAFMNIGAFAVVTHFSREGERAVQIEDLAGLGARHRGAAALFSIFLLSLIGVPLTGGFFGKFYIFKAAIDSSLVGLAVVGLLNSAVAAYYYLRVIVVMYFHEPGEATESAPQAPPAIRLALWGSALATLALGVFPGPVLEFATRWAGLAK